MSTAQAQARSFEVVVTTPMAAHESALHIYREFMKPQVGAGVAGTLSWHPKNSPRKQQLRKVLHNTVLKTFAWDLWLPDPDRSGMKVRWIPEAWKRHFMNIFHPGVESSEDLTDDEYSAFIQQIEAYGVTEWGLEFPEKDEHVAPHPV